MPLLNPLAAALFGNDSQIVPDGQGGFVPITNSRVAPDGSLSPHISLATSLSNYGEQPQINTAPFLSKVQSTLAAAPRGIAPDSSAGSSAGPEPDMTLHGLPMTSYQQALKQQYDIAYATWEAANRRALAAASSNPNATSVYQHSADQALKLANDYVGAYIETLKVPSQPQTVSPGQGVLNQKTGKYEVQIPARSDHPAKVSPGEHVYNPDTGQYEVPVPAVEPPVPHPITADERKAWGLPEEGSYSLEPGGIPKLIPGSAPESKLTSEAIDEIAARALQGDNSGLAGLGYGKVGATNRAAVANRVASMMHEQGKDPTEIVRNIVGLGGEKAGARTLGQLGARINTFAEEAGQTGEAAIQASDAVSRTKWVPINQLMQMGRAVESDPALNTFQALNNALANTYAKAVNPTGVPTDEGRRAAFAILNTAKGPEGYEAAVRALQREIRIVQGAVQKSKSDMSYGAQSNPALSIPSSAQPPVSRKGVYVPGKGIQWQ